MGAKVENIEKYVKEWEESTLKNILKKAPERKERFVTPSDIEMQRVYTELDIQDFDYVTSLGMPGQYPFTRNIQPTAYRGRLWTMRQYSGFGTAQETNKRFKFLLQEGQTGLSVAFDLPTQIGYDSDHPMSRGEVGKVGVAIDTLEDMEVLFDGIPLSDVSTSMTINSTAAILLSMYVSLAAKQGADLKKLRGTIQNDILKEYVARGTYIYPPKESMRIITDIFSYCKDVLPSWNTISISGYHIREAGSTAVQEVAFTLANGIAYVEAAIKAGLNVDEFAARLSFFFNVHNNFIEEIAKFRAARRLWARIMKERFAAKDPRSCMLRFHTQTAGCTLTAQQPMNNIIRVTLQSLAAILGGTQSLHTNSYDEALALPSEEAVRIALRTQQIIGYESGTADTVDPLGGSYALESMTDDIEEKSREYIEKIDSLGGAVRAIEKGFMQKEISDSAYTYQMDIQKKENVVVGVNRFTTEEPPPTELLKVDPELEVFQTNALKKVREKRDNQKVKDVLKRLEDIATSEDNVVPVVLEAVNAYASLGEISDVFRQVFGEYRGGE